MHRTPTGLHVCLVSCFPPSNGPLSEYTYHLAMNFLRDPRIAKVTVLADRLKNEKISFSDNRLQIIRCWDLDALMTPIRIVSEIRRLKPNIVHLNLVFRHFSSSRIKNFLGLCTPAILRLLKLPVVVTLHSIAEAVSLEEVGYNNNFVNRLGYKLATRIILTANSLTVTHPFMLKILKQKYRANNVTYLHHGVFTEPPAECNIEGKRILLFGKMGPYKNPSLALDAFKEIVHNDSEAKLIIAGSSHPLHPNFLESILDRYKDVPNIQSLGYIDEKDIPSLFLSSTVVVLPYTTSPWSSGVLSQACTFGRPVVASDLPDFRELATDGVGVILFPAGDRDSLIKSLTLVLNDKGLQKRLGEANLAWARRYGFNNTVKNLIDIFEALVNKYQSDNS